MKIIGEKINGTRKTVAAAIANRDAAFIQNLAKKQVDGGAHWLDVNAGTHPDREVDDMLWLIGLIQEVTDVTLCLDSANPKALAAAIGAVKKTPMINSISGEPDRLSNVLPIVAQHGCEVIALAMDDKGIPADVAGRMSVVRKLFEATRAVNVPDEKVYVDALVMTIATNIQAGPHDARHDARHSQGRVPDGPYFAGPEQRLVWLAGALVGESHLPDAGRGRWAWILPSSTRTIGS